MILSVLDCFFVLMIAIIFGFIIHLEVQMNMMLEMMKEHIKVDEKLCDISKHIKKPPIQDK